MNVSTESIEQSAIEWLRSELDDPEITGFDNFLDIGGHSLIFSRLNQFLGDSFRVVLDQQTTYSDPLSAAVVASRRIGFGLSAEELMFFHQNGYIGPLTIYTPDEMAALWRTVQRESLDRSHAAYPEVDKGIGAPNIFNYDRHLDIDVLAEHVCNAKIVDRVASILGPDLLCWRSEFFPKYPGDEGTDWHQADTFANASGKPQLLWPGESEADFGAGTLTVWTAFTDSTRENGCLQIIPGTQNRMNYDETKHMRYDEERINAEVKNGVPRGFFGYDYRELQIDPDWKPNEQDAYSLVMEKGQCVIFWSTLMHASLPNTSKKDYRMGFATRYVPTKVRVYPDTGHIEEYGGTISLDRWGAVLARGRDEHGHNRITTETLRGTPYRTVSR